MKKESIDRRRFLQALGLFALAGVGSAARAQEGKTFVELSPAQPTLAGKIEVIEFFHYGCPHCRHLDPLVEGWKKTLGGDVAFHRSPVIWGQGALAGLARLYFSLEATGQLEALHPKIFAAVQDERRLVYDRDGARAWVLSLTFAGYQFGNLPWIQRNLSAVILGIIVVSLLPAAIAWLRQRRAAVAQG